MAQIKILVARILALFALGCGIVAVLLPFFEGSVWKLGTMGWFAGGALLAFAPTAFYASYGARPAAWGFSLLEDQQLAGLLMMTAGAMMYLMAMVALVAVWFGKMEKTHPANGRATVRGTEGR